MEGSPSIADQLARLKVLESDFQRALEAEKLESLAEFAAGAGHEINNPLTVISGRAQLLLREETDPERRHALALISVQAMRVHEMIADMMLFARPPRPELQPVDLVRLIEEMIVELTPGCQRQGTSIKGSGVFSPDELDLPPLLLDPVQIGVALRAICRNSLEALQSGGGIEITVEMVPSSSAAGGTCRTLEGDSPIFVERKLGQSPSCSDASAKPSPPNRLGEVLIHIRDDGPGIKPEERRHLFDPYYSARQAGRGLGVGLSKAWRIITNHGGRLEVESEPGRGATFTVVLPVTC